MLPTLIGALFILGALLVAFSKEKTEDEFIANIRQSSLVWAVLVNYAIHDMTQEELAKKIGVSRQTINAMESNKYVPSTVLALKLAKLFKKPVEEVFFLEKGD